ncbi:MAG TPA: helix-hairpin-helix domain-containing protein [Tepidisphaeraceae bacterium]|nr:helix-hairpin-helix domain-containing protein [Tepidisphaeraceae bacterium]
MIRLRPPELWTGSQRGVLVTLLGGLLIYLIIRLVLNPLYVSDPQPVRPSRYDELADKIDPNTADWQTLAALPGLGEKRARTIIQYREAFTKEHPDHHAFEEPETSCSSAASAPPCSRRCGRTCYSLRHQIH